jgi:hypothetical protein
VVYDPDSEAMGCTNELYYRNGPTPEPIELKDAPEVVDTIKRYLDEAFLAGRNEALKK